MKTKICKECGFIGKPIADAATAPEAIKLRRSISLKTTPTKLRTRKSPLSVLVFIGSANRQTQIAEPVVCPNGWARNLQFVLIWFVLAFNFRKSLQSRRV